MARVSQGTIANNAYRWDEGADAGGTGHSLLSNFLLTSTGLAALLILAAALGLAGFEYSFQDKVFPGVLVWNVDLSGMTQAEAATALQTAFAYPGDTRLTFRDGQRSWSTTLADVGLRLDAQATAAQAYEVGRNQTLLPDLVVQLSSWWQGYQLSPVVLFDQARATAYLSKLAADIDRPVQEARLSVKGATVSSTPSQAGRQLDIPATLPLLTAPLQNPQATDINLVIHETQPKLVDVSGTEATLRMIFSAPLTLVLEGAPASGPGPWTLTVDQLGQVTKVQQTQGTDGVQLQVSLDRQKLLGFLKPISDTIHQSSVDARFTFTEETKQLQVLQHSSSGRDLDANATVDRIIAQAATDNRQVRLVVNVTQPVVNDQATGADLGITELVAEAYTTFGGSPPDRITNITTAASRFHGVVIAPGDVFSFDQYLGDVSLDNGFAEALIIFNGRTIQGVGGGVCQVSTTLYRAAFFGGFPIVERYPHAYRVGYYEHVFGPGLDATVYSPIVDFRFKNDTSSHLLIESFVDKVAARLTFRLYGTKDGREVQVSSPAVTNVIAHGPDIYEADPSLPAGTIRKVDYAVDGADVTVNRVVTRDGAVLYKDRVFTRYEPWQAVFKYGPGTTGIPGTGQAPTPPSGE